MSQFSPEREHDQAFPTLFLHYATWGEYTDSEHVVLLVHGLTANHRTWAVLAPALADQGWFVVAPDLRGRGLSARPAHGYGLPLHAGDLLTLLDSLKLSTVHVVGHSLGAIIGLYLAALYPQRVRSLVLVDAGGVIPPDTAQAIGASLARLGTVYPSLDAYLAAMRQAPLYQWNEFWEQYFRYDAQVQVDGTVSSRVPRAAITEEMAALQATRTEILPASVRQPTLILRATVGMLGADRGFILPVEEAERLLQVISGSRLVELPETNHYTIVLDEGFRQTVTVFLAEESARKHV